MRVQDTRLESCAVELHIELAGAFCWRRFSDSLLQTARFALPVLGSNRALRRQGSCHLCKLSLVKCQESVNQKARTSYFNLVEDHVAFTVFDIATEGPN